LTDIGKKGIVTPDNRPITVGFPANLEKGFGFEQNGALP
jgi:hypothetical protein